ncbi:Type IV secretory pathway VirD4 component-like protein, partial [mine drainage metagenome]
LVQLGAVDAARPGAARFSLRRWMLGTAHENVRLVILNSNAMYAGAQEALWGAMLAVVAATISAAMPEKSADDDGALWLIADEAPQLGPAGLERLLVIQEVGRSRAVRVIIAAQEESQFAARCGMEKAAPMLSMQGLKIYGRCSDATADAIVRRVGNREIQRIENTASGGAVQGKTSRHDSVPVLMPADITGLRLTDEGPELLVQIGDVIGRVVQLFGPKPVEREPQLIECPAWRAARLPDPPAPAPQPAPPQPTPPATDGGRAPPQEQEPAFDSDIDSPFTHEPDADPDPAEDFDWTKE